MVSEEQLLQVGPENQQGLDDKSQSKLTEILKRHSTYINIESNRQLRTQQLGSNCVNDIYDALKLSLPVLSSDFPIKNSIQNITISKVSEVKSAFNHAAYCLLRAALIKQQKDKKDSRESLTYHDSVNLSQIINVSTSIPVIDNDFDFSGDKAEESTSNSLNSPIIQEVIKRARSQQQHEDEINRKKQKLHDEKKEKMIKNSSSSSSPNTKKTGSGVTLSASSTKAPSSMVDSRATVARAILCAAASVAFSELTPDLKNNQTRIDNGINLDETKEAANIKSSASIDPLDVPQNTHYNKDGNNHKEDSSSEQDQGEVITKSQEEQCETKNKASSSSTNHTKTPVVNMGAVMMQAKTLGKRAISYALAAARRGRERHRFSVKSAIQQQYLEKLQHRYPMLPTTSTELQKSKKQGCHSPTSTTALLSVCIPNPFGLSYSNKNSNLIKMENEYSNLFDRAYDPPYPVFNDEMVVASKLQSDRNREKEKIMLTDYWKNTCLERMKEIIMKGMGNMIYFDMEWIGRSQRIADFLRHLAFLDDEIKRVDDSKAKFSHIENYGPHLIVTSEIELETWKDAFPKLSFFMRNGESSFETNENQKEKSDDLTLRSLFYIGNSTSRKRLRRHLRFMIPVSNSNTPSRCSSGPPSLVYTKDSQFHVVITTYRVLIRDFIHLSQIPWQVVILDDGMGWLGASQHDPNGKVGRAWDGLWSKADGGIGMAGAFTVNSRNFDSEGFSDFCDDDDSSVSSSMSTDSSSSTSSCSSSSVTKKNDKKTKQKQVKCKTIPISSIPSHLGLTCRHRILLASSLTSTYRGSIYPSPVPMLLSFLIPPFSEVTREEWDRSRIYNCPASMKHYRGLLARSVVTYVSSTPVDSSVDSGVDNDMTEIMNLDQIEIAKRAMEGIGFFAPENRQELMTNGSDKSQMISTDLLISSGKFMQSRRFAVAWLTNNLKHEFALSSLDPILEAIQKAGKAGHVCEEVVVAPVTCAGVYGGSNIGSTQSGNSWGGGSGGFRCAIRCGRTFTSEQGLRQHLAALHAPPGTWLCRSCGGDCGTSQARTHHERYCATGGAPGGPNGGAVSTVGQVGITAKQHGPGVGKQSGVTSSGTRGVGAKNDGEKVDKDGSFRVPGYRGVWVNPAGKNFVKIKEDAFLEEKEIKLFATADEAAKFHDKIVKENSLVDVELNFKEDGKTRIVYEDKSSMASAGRGLEMLGGGASSVVPALSVINIKDLPKNVKPLLRDPKQTSRTGGNSKRFIYAYRGVCRQARKGHDRWQSQISFGGTNHYLGTFDSEWDAAAIYAWAHLILYGEEATRKAQREGEEAAAAWEQEKKDIAAGKIVVPTKPVRKKKSNTPKIAGSKKAKSGASQDGKSSTTKTPQKKKGSKKETSTVLSGKNSKKQMVMTVTDAIQKTDSSLIVAAKERIMSSRILRKQKHTKMFTDMAMCIPVTGSNPNPSGWAMLVGLSSDDFDWGMADFITQFPDAEDLLDEASFTTEYGPSGNNAQFRCALQGIVCTLGLYEEKVEKASQSIGLGKILLGGSAGKVDCNVGGLGGSCSSFAARIDYCPTLDSDYHFAACNDDDVVTLNGLQIKASDGSFPVRNEDICSVGPRVFMFLLPIVNKK